MNAKEISVKNAVMNITKGTMGVFLAVDENCDKMFTKAALPMFAGRLRKRVLWRNPRIGVGYENKVNARVDDKSFIASDRRGFKWISYPSIEESLGKGKVFVTFNYAADDEKVKKEFYYTLDGVRIDENKVKELEVFFLAKYKTKETPISQKQLEKGVDKDRQVEIVRYLLNEVEYIGRSSKDAMERYLI